VRVPGVAPWGFGAMAAMAAAAPWGPASAELSRCGRG